MQKEAICQESFSAHHLIKSYTHESDIPRDCIVFDLDGTLIYSAKKPKGKAEKIEFLDMHGDPMILWVHKRPGFDKFLEACFNSSVVGVWSMGQPGYVNAVVNLFPQKPAFIYNWCNCDRAQGKIFKRLNNIPYSGRILMVEDDKAKLEQCDRVTTIILPEWHPKHNQDTALYNLSLMLFGSNEPSC